MQKTNWGFLVFSFCDCIFNLNRIFCSGNCLSPSLIVKWQKALQMPEVNTMLFLFLPFFFFFLQCYTWIENLESLKSSAALSLTSTEPKFPSHRPMLMGPSPDCSWNAPSPTLLSPANILHVQASLPLLSCSTSELSDRSTPKLPPCRDVGEDDVLKDEGTARNTSQ